VRHDVDVFTSAEVWRRVNHGATNCRDAKSFATLRLRAMVVSREREMPAVATEPLRCLCSAIQLASSLPSDAVDDAIRNTYIVDVFGNRSSPIGVHLFHRRLRAALLSGRARKEMIHFEAEGVTDLVEWCVRAI
jgi:hypothetical protein